MAARPRPPPPRRDSQGRQGVPTTMPDRLTTLLPYPATVRARPGQLALHPDIPVRAGPQAQQAADAVRQVLTALPWPPSPPPAPDAGPEILVDADGALSAEGYRLLIGPDRVKISAAGPAGAFYAAQTIRQLLPDEAFRAAPVAGPDWILPCAEIEDAPALPWRGGHLDVSRHFFPKRTVLGF